MGFVIRQLFCPSSHARSALGDSLRIRSHCPSPVSNWHRHATPVPSHQLPIWAYQPLSLVEDLGWCQPIRHADPTHMPLLAQRHRQADHRCLRNRDHVVTATPHTTLPPTLYTCPPPARPLSSRTTVPSPLCSQPRVVSTRCIGSRRPPLTNTPPSAASTHYILTPIAFSTLPTASNTILADTDIRNVSGPAL